jgi:hypothetical protein
MKTMRIVILTALMFVLMACSSKSILEQSEITVKSNSRVSIVAKSGADRYHWREISGIKVKIVDPYSQRLEFVAPDVSKKEMLVFELEAHFGEVTRTAEVMVIVLPLEEGYDNTSTDDSNTTSSGYDNGSTRSDDDNATTDEDDNIKQLIGNYGYPKGNLSDKKAIIFCTYSSPRLAVTTFFLNLPIRRLKRGVFHICGIRNILYKRYFAVPFVEEKRRKKFLEDTYRTAKYFK